MPALPGVTVPALPGVTGSARPGGTGPIRSGEPLPVLPRGRDTGAAAVATSPPAVVASPPRAELRNGTRLARGASALSAVLHAAAGPDDETGQPSTEDSGAVRPGPLAPSGVSGDPWPDPDGEPAVDALADAVLQRLGDQVELEYHRTYGPGEW